MNDFDPQAPAAPYYISGPNPDGSYSMCELGSGRIVFRTGEAAPTVAEPAMQSLLNLRDHFSKLYKDDCSAGYKKWDAARAKVDEAIRGLPAAAPPRAAPTVVEPATETWRCFHCNEVFTTVVDAAFHFGYADLEKPACLVDARELRKMELELRRHREEDTDLHRQIHGMEARHRTALMRAEEDGYAKGLRDAATSPRAPREPLSVDAAIGLLVDALSASKGWLRGYADATIRHALDYRGAPRERLTVDEVRSRFDLPFISDAKAERISDALVELGIGTDREGE